MAAQFGRWSFEGLPSDPAYLASVGKLLAPYGPDGVTSYSKGGLSIFYHAFHTTAESRRERQPHVSASGVVLTWDGRLDNRAELIRQSNGLLPQDASDLSIVAAAYARRGVLCFRDLVGDWSLSIWDPRVPSLILAKDPIGTRHVYYSLDKKQFTWCTVLDPLLLCARKQFALDEEYLAGWLSSCPAAHRTPYVGIEALLPSSYLRVQPAKHAVSKYWDFDPGKRVRYRTDAEYEEHFRTVFADSVRRRLRSDTPILSELSGGIDSSAVVCTADSLIARGFAETPRLDTISYYDDTEPNWNERPYFTKVEEWRGRTGCHIDLSKSGAFDFVFERPSFALAPGSEHRADDANCKFAACLISGGHRAVLSGTGGDEVTGGVPTPMPELADLLARAHFQKLAPQLKAWALDKRKPWFYLLGETLCDFMPPNLVPALKPARRLTWLQPDFVRRQRAALTGYETRLRFFGPLPSFQYSLGTLARLRRRLALEESPSRPCYEKRYPYLDRDLLEFLFAVPRDQLVRPGHRRSLMRRALAGIVPSEVLGRRRKAFVARAPLAALARNASNLLKISHDMMSASLGIVEPRKLREALHSVRQGKEVPVVLLLRTLRLEFWLRALSERAILRDLPFSVPPNPLLETAEGAFIRQSSAS